MTRRRSRFSPGVRIRHGHRLGRIVMDWDDGKWAVQLAGDPQGSYTLLRPEQMKVVATAASTPVASAAAS